MTLKPYIKFSKLNPKAIIPSKTFENGGYDIYGCIEKDYFINSHTTRLIPTGIASEIPNDWTFILRERGNTGAKGIELRAGVIDAGYRGEWFIALTNGTNKTFVISVDPERTKSYLIKRYEKFLKEKYKENYRGFNQETYIERNFIIYPVNKAIAQALLVYTPHVEPEVVSFEQLSKTERGEGKLGSSGK